MIGIPDKAQRKVKRILVVLAALVVIGVALGFGLKTPPTAVLPDGTVLRITGVKVGYTNEFRHGNRLEKILGDWIPTNGWKVGKWELERPEVVRHGTKASTQMARWQVTGESNLVLTVEFQLAGESNLVSNSELLASLPFMLMTLDWRVVHWGEDGYRYVDWLPVFSKRRDGYFGYVDLKSYARASERLNLEIQKWEKREKRWQSIARFEIENPERGTVESWTPTNAETFVYGAFSAVPGSIQVRQPMAGVRRHHALQVPFQFGLNGRNVTNWRVEELEVYDASGNFETNEWLEIESAETNGWTIMRARRAANPHLPWRMKGHFTEWRDFAASNLFRVKLSGLSDSVITNFLGWPVTVGRFGNRVEAGLAHEPPWRRMVLVDIVGEGGSVMESAWRSNQWHYFGSIRRLNGRRAEQEMTVVVAIAQDIPFEFTVQPRLVEEVEEDDIQGRR